MLVSLLIIFGASWMTRQAIRPARLLVAAIALAWIASAAVPGRTAFADDRYSRPLTLSRLDEADSRTKKAKGSQQQHLREGTRIPPTVGQIVMLGRRWAFVPASHDKADRDDLVDNALPSTAPAARLDDRPRPTRLGGASLRSTHRGAVPSTLVSNKQGAPESENGRPHIILTENLMLQRIVEAIRADASDDQWNVSGEVTEFFHENRLTIRTAQRANSDR